jgi:hypothetical protein
MKKIIISTMSFMLFYACSKPNLAEKTHEFPELGKRLLLTFQESEISLNGYVPSPDVELKTKWYIGKKAYDASGKKTCKSAFNICKLKEAALKLKLSGSSQNSDAIQSENDGIETVCEIYENYFMIKMPFISNEFRIQSFFDNEILYNSNNYKLDGLEFKSITINKGDYKVYKKGNEYFILARYSINY